MSEPDFPILDVSGTPDQIGAAHGEAQRERIREYTERFLEWLLTGSKVSLTEESLWARWAPQLAVNERLAPDLVTEMRAIARGAAVPFERVFLLNSQLDIMCFFYQEPARIFEGCSTFAVRSDAQTGKTLLGQTYDMPEFLEEYVLLLRINPAAGPRQLVFTFAGIVGANGFNDAGLGVCINYLSPLDCGPGRLHSIIIRQILAAPNFADALRPPVIAPRAGGAHYLLADSEGNVISIETTGKHHQVVLPQENAIGHTNHYLSAELRDQEFIREHSIGSSLARYATLCRYFRERGDRVNLESLRELTRNHTSHPRSICAHRSQSELAGNRTKTVAAMVNVLADRTMFVTRGCPCEGSYRSIHL